MSKRTPIPVIHRLLALFILPLLVLSCAIDGGKISESVVTNSTTSQFIDPDSKITQIDRCGRPGINFLLIESDIKDLFNRGEPVRDFRFNDRVLPVLNSLGKGNTDTTTLLQTLLPDILVIDTALPSTLSQLNGRTLLDDAPDILLQLLTGNSSASDHVSANDLLFLTDFPYLAKPH